jgi:hypothetical protein
VSTWIDIGALWRVALISTMFGVGVVALYALGIVATTAPEGGQVSRSRRGLGALCYVLFFAVIIFAIRVILAK